MNETSPAGARQLNENGPVSRRLTDWLTPVSLRQNRLSEAHNGLGSLSGRTLLISASETRFLGEKSEQIAEGFRRKKVWPPHDHTMAVVAPGRSY